MTCDVHTTTGTTHTFQPAHSLQTLHTKSVTRHITPPAPHTPIISNHSPQTPNNNLCANVQLGPIRRDKRVAAVHAAAWPCAAAEGWGVGGETCERKCVAAAERTINEISPVHACHTLPLANFLTPCPCNAKINIIVIVVIASVVIKMMISI